MNKVIHTKRKHLIILIGLLAVCLNVQADIYWNPSTGNDSNNGSTEAKAVKSFSMAKSLVTSSSDWIILCARYDISSSITLDGSKGSYNVRVKRKSGVGYLIQVNAGGALTLKNITLSGGLTGDVQGTYSTIGGNAIIFMNDKDASVVLKDGAILRDNWTSYGPAIKSYDGGTIRMEGGEITNCGTEVYGGAICMFSNNKASNFYMSGGKIHHCYAEHGGGAYCYRCINYVYSGYSMTIEISGGEISDCKVGNGSAQGGGAFYINSEKLQSSSTVSFTMTGGTIEDCTAPKGGALFVTGKNTLNLNGGTIDNCTATGTKYTSGGTTHYYKSMGGAVYMVTNTEQTTEQNSEISMGVTTGEVTSGTTIQNCGADSIGGGVYMRNLNNNSTVSFTMNAGGLINLCSCVNYNGGGVYMAGKATFTMNGGEIKYCTALNGAGVFMTSVDNNATASFTMGDGAVINNCTAVTDGGGIYMKEQAEFTMNGGEIKYCHTKSAGGGVAVIGKAAHLNSVYVHGGEIHHCDALPASGHGGNGGGLHFQYSNVLIDGENVLVHDNESTGYGGGINVQHGNLTINDGKIYNNRIVTWTEGGGGAIHFSRSQVFIMTGGEIYGNSSVGSGGAFHASYVNGVGDYIRISGGKIYNNTSVVKGGAFNINTGSLLEFVAGSGGQCVEMYGNKSCRGGAVSIDGGLLNIEAGSFHDNEADETLDVSVSEYKGFGGAFLVMTESTANTTSGKLNISGAEFYHNVASQDGGAIYLQRELFSIASDEPSLTISGGTIHNNTATNGNGGGIYYDTETKMYVDNGSMMVKDNLAHGIPNNVYIQTGNVIDIKSGVTTFRPLYVGFYTENRTPNIPVFRGTNAQVSAIYNGMTSVPMTTNVVDDSQDFSPLRPGSPGTEYNYILYFGDGSPWSPLQQTVDTLPTTVGGVYQIGTVKELTAFLWLVNNIDTHHDFNADLSEGETTHPEASAKLTADIDMEGHYWVPISTGYTGTFDGNGFTISHLTMVPTNASSGRGMFGTNTSGTIKNVILKDCYFGASTGYLGSIVCQNNGTLANSVAGGELVATETGVIMGGLAGSNGGTIHSSIATPEMYGYQMGGLVGENTGYLYNSFANTSFNYMGSSEYCGGLVGDNTNGTVENCYSHVQGTAPTSNFGWLVGDNTDGTVSYCYIPDGQSTYKAAGNDPSYHGTYGTTSTPYLYNHRDNQITLDSGTSTYVSNQSGADNQMRIVLNEWVTDKNLHDGGNYPYWLRTTSEVINDDLPLLKLPATNAVAATNAEAYLDYNTVNDLIADYTASTQAICLYANETSMDGNDGSSARLYIDQEAMLTQSGNGGDINAYTSQMVRTYTSSRWHNFSSPLQNSSIGFVYGTEEQVDFSWGPNPCGVTFSDKDSLALFPSNTPSVTNVDLYCFYEPEYHWLNFKRNTNSHWHMDATTVPIIYNGNGIGANTNGNETYLVPGKGYLVSIDVDQLLQNYGKLNNGEVYLYSVTKSDYNAWAERLGFNLLGNPYQSYLDFDKFVNQNRGNLWSSNGAYAETYAIFDPNLNSYVQYKQNVTYGNDYTASQYIHPHQGFFIRKTATDNATNTKVTYTNAMRLVTLPNDASEPSFRSGSQAFPLINFLVRDAEGNGDVAVLELGRDDDEGALKMRLGNCEGRISLGYEGDEYGILFRTKVEDYQSLHFEASETGTFTLTWNTANGEFESLKLIDNIAGTTTDMLNHDSYTFEGNPDQYSSRFKIVVGDYKDIEENEDGASTGSATETFAYYANGEIHLAEPCHGASIQIIDVMGRIILCKDASYASAIPTTGMAPGVYMLRLTENSNGVRTQKIIIE